MIIVHLVIKSKLVIIPVLFVLLEPLEQTVVLAQRVALHAMLQVLPHALLVLEATSN